MTEIFSYVFPFLLVVALCQRGMTVLRRDSTGWVPNLMMAFVSGLVVIMPVGGLPVGRWLISLFANPSIPLTALLFCHLMKRSFGIEILDIKSLQACGVFSLLAGMALYPMALGIGPFDPYAAGWHFSWFFVLIFLVTMALLFFRNRFSAVLLAAVIAYDLQLLESGNLWDYVVDPILVLVSAVYFLSNFIYIRQK